jgi:hypothetical protein
MGSFLILACCTIIHKLFGGVLTPIVRSQDLNIIASLVLNQSSELLKFVEDFILSLQKVYLGLPGVVINEYNKVFEATH